MKALKPRSRHQSKLRAPRGVKLRLQCAARHLAPWIRLAWSHAGCLLAVASMAKASLPGREPWVTMVFTSRTCLRNALTSVRDAGDLRKDFFNAAP